MAIKVCHMTSAHGTEDVRIFHKECVSLVRAGYDVFLVGGGHSYEKDGVHIIGVGNVSGGRLHRMTTVTKMVYNKALKINADIYHFHDPELLPYGLKLKRKGKKVIFDSHEKVTDSILEKQYIPVAFRYIVYWLYSYYQRYVCRKLDAVIYVTPNLESYYKNLNNKICLITNYPIWSEVSVKEDRTRAVVFAGGISAQWNHDLIIKALAEISDCIYNLCGPGDEDYIERLKKEKAWDKVNFLGRIPHKQVAKILAASSIGLALLSPGKNTDNNTGTLGNTKIFEEMMNGLPVVCTNFTLWRDFVDRYHCGICVNPHNIDEIVKAIQYLLDNPEEAKIMGKNGRRAVREEFNWDTQAEKLVDFYRSIE